jgi:hypothetical protein
METENKIGHSNPPENIKVNDQGRITLKNSILKTLKKKQS